MDVTLTIEKIADRLRPMPWRNFAIAIAAAFVMASAISTVIAMFFMPSDLKKPAVGAGLSTPNQNQTIPDIAFSNATLDKPGLDMVLNRNIFNSEGEKEDTSKSKDKKVGADVAKSDLPLKLWGLIYGGDPFSGIAIVENTQKHTTNSFMVGDLLEKEATVKEVQEDRIIIVNNNRAEYVMIENQPIQRTSRKRGKPKVAAPEAASGDRPFAVGAPPEKFQEEGFSREKGDIQISQSYLGKTLAAENLAQVLQDAKAEPNIVDGELRGFKLTRIKAGSIYEKSGFMNGDVIREINGVSLNDANQSIKLLQQLRNEPEVEIRYDRGGTMSTALIKVR